MRFLIDEDLPRSLVNLFQQYGHEAFHVRDVGLRAAPDEEIAAYAQRNNLCLISGDLGFADVRNYPPDAYSGIVVLRLPSAVSAAQIHQLIRSWLESEWIDQCEGNLTILEPTRVRIRRGSSP